MNLKFLLLTFIFFSFKSYAIDELKQNKQETNKYDYMSIVHDCWMLSGLAYNSGIILKDIYSDIQFAINSKNNKNQSNDQDQHSRFEGCFGDGNNLEKNNLLDKLAILFCVAIPTLYSAKSILKDLFYKLKKQEIKQDNSRIKTSVFLIKNLIVIANIFTLANVAISYDNLEYETKTKKFLALGYAMGLIWSLKDLKDELVLEYKYRLKIIKESKTKKINN